MWEGEQRVFTISAVSNFIAGRNNILYKNMAVCEMMESIELFYGIIEPCFRNDSKAITRFKFSHKLFSSKSLKEIIFHLIWFLVSGTEFINFLRDSIKYHSVSDIEIHIISTQYSRLART